MEAAPLALLLLLTLRFSHRTRPEELQPTEETETLQDPPRPPLDPQLGNVELDIILEQGGEPGPPPDYSKFPKAKNEQVKFGDSQTKSSLWWVPFRNTSLFEVGYLSEPDNFDQQYVCRPAGLCVFGYVDRVTYVCIYSQKKKVLTTEDFMVLVNKDNFEILEWKEDSYGKAPKYGIRNCKHNYVGRHASYGLGNVHTESRAFYLPWPQNQKEYWYYYYEVLTVVREPYDQRLSEVSYLMEKKNITRHQPHTLKMSKVSNNHDQEVKKTVSLSETTETVSTWETGFSVSLMLSSTVSAGIPNIAEASVTVGVETSISLSKSNSKSESEQHSLSVEVPVPPGHTCEVRMEGTKTEAAIPFTAEVTKVYKGGREHHTRITGMYRGVQVGEINAKVEQCVPIPGASPGRGSKGAARPCTQAPGFVVLLSVAVATMTAVFIS